MDTLFDSQKKIAIVLDQFSKDVKAKNSIEKKIEKLNLLKKQIINFRKDIDTVKSICNDHAIAQQEKEFFLNKEKLLLKLYKRYKEPSFSLGQKDILESYILDEIAFLSNNGQLSQRISEVHEEITQHIKQDMSDFEKEMLNDMTKEMLNNMGVDIDDDFDMSDLENPEFIAEFQQKYFEKYHEDQKQINYENQEKKVTKTDTHFQKLYKKLVKKVHPDLVLDSEEKEKCEIWMKRLSQAWNDRKYYELLLIQKEIDSDDTSEVILNEKQLRPLIEQLNKEIERLDFEKYVLKHEDPDTSYYYKNFYAKSKKGILKKIDNFKKNLVLLKNEDDDTLEFLKTQKSTKIMLNEIREQDKKAFFELW